ncbi:12847_t:CDS:2 [Acaulospora morrowiae]|uniref:12847_t:CDS:1 n=1 Tax=Acaulospora morrowiae TaxID=94023 RepID=A0A9N8VAS8_9GLOM|nr:12847_t:CDS:2 [Acaulospora morrowiae]
MNGQDLNPKFSIACSFSRKSAVKKRVSLNDFNIPQDIPHDFLKDHFLQDLLYFFISQCNLQELPKYVALEVNHYLKQHSANPIKVFYKLLRQSKHNLLYISGLIGFCYEFGIGSVIDHQMAFEYYSYSENLKMILDNNAKLKIKCKNDKFKEQSPGGSYFIIQQNYFISQVSLALMYQNGCYVSENKYLGFQIFTKLASEKSVLAETWNYVGDCYLNIVIPVNEIDTEDIGELGTDISDLGVSTNGLDEGIDEIDLNKINADMAIASVDRTSEREAESSKRYAKSLEYFSRSASKEYPESTFNVGYCHIYGFGTEQNDHLAFQYFLKSAEFGFELGQHQVGLCYLNGMGTGENLGKAIYWLLKAKNNGCTNVEGLLTMIINRLDYM